MVPSATTSLPLLLLQSYLLILSRAHKHALNAYRETSWSGHPGHGPPPPYPPGGYHHPSPGGHHHGAWGGPWASQSAEKFGPAPSANSPAAITLKWTSISTPKTTALPLNRNKITVADCRDGDKLYRPGDKWTPSGGCGRYSCSSAGKTTTILGCPSLELPANCTVSALDPRQPWPLCCPRLLCD